MADRVLVVDDEAPIRHAVRRALQARGYEVVLAADGEHALTKAEDLTPDVVVLDLNLPGMDGLEVCRQLREWTSVPILVLSVREDESDKVTALDLGADDYLTKPFGTDELLARVRALLRRAEPPEAVPRFRAGDVEIDLASRSVRRGSEGVRLTRTEWELLGAFAEHPGKLLTHGWLLREVWGDGYDGDVEVLRVFVSQLRKKIEPDPRRPSFIVTEPGVGYRWAVRPAAEATA
jgi:two-component system KDP operon response regulator KdpE